MPDSFRPQDTALGRWLDRCRAPGVVLALTGSRGAGKAAFIRRWAAARGVGTAVVDCSRFACLRLGCAADIVAHIQSDAGAATTLVLEEPGYLPDPAAVFRLLAARPHPRLCLVTSSARILAADVVGALGEIEEFRLRPDPARPLAPAEIQRLWNTCLLRDIGGTGRLQNLRQAERLAQLLWDQRGDSIAARRLSDELSMPGERLSPNSVEAYLRHLVDSYLVEKVAIYMGDKRRLCKSGFRYFFSDPALVYGVFGPSPAEDARHDDLNRAYLALVARGGMVRIAANFGENWRFVTGEPGRGHALWRFDGARSLISDAGVRLAW
ncbi:MAG: hypothetical protein ACI4R9_03990 [Kiritimatiellia bacterium]